MAHLPANFRYGSKSGVEIKVCVRTYRIFFETGGEDLFYRKRTGEEEALRTKKAEEREAERKDRFKSWMDTKVVANAEVEMNGIASEEKDVKEVDGTGEKRKEEEDVEMVS